MLSLKSARHMWLSKKAKNPVNCVCALHSEICLSKNLGYGHQGHGAVT